jgi:hypothetical protein
MTNRAQELLDSTMELTLRPQKDDRKKLIAFILREAVNQLQYQSFHHTEEYYQLDARAILDVADELEAL